MDYPMGTPTAQTLEDWKQQCEKLRAELTAAREKCKRLERTLRLVLERIAADKRGRPADPEVIDQLVAAMVVEGDAAARLDQALAALAATEEDE